MDKCIIFDCDGVLVDSEILAHQAGIDALKKLGYDLTLEKSIEIFTGKSHKDSAQVFFDAFGVILHPDFFNNHEHTQAISNLFAISLKPLNQSTLTFLHNLGIEKCVASNSSRERVLHSLKLTNQLQFFDEEKIFTAQQVEKGKPAPDLFLLAAKTLGYNSHDCIVIEDSPAGIEAALAAEMTVIGFLEGSHTCFDWYKQKIKSYGVPVAHNGKELEGKLANYLANPDLLYKSA
jgi:HAD superfamily hydrolase (TIGR01509 family)